MNNNKLIVMTNTGEQLSFDVLARITNRLGSRNIIYFTDNKYDEQGQLIVYASYYLVENDQVKLINEMTEEDFNDLKELYSELQASVSNNSEGSGETGTVTTNPYNDVEVL